MVLERKTWTCHFSLQCTMIVRLHLFVITSACWRKSVLVSMSRTHSMPPHFKKCTFNNNNIAQIIIIKKLNYITVAILPILESSCLYIFFRNKILLVEKHQMIESTAVASCLKKMEFTCICFWIFSGRFWNNTTCR